MPGGPAAEQSRAALQALAVIITAGGAACPILPAAADALSSAADRCPEPAWPEGLVGRPCPMPAAQWHLQRLLETTADDTAGRARRVYHARLLAYMLAPEEPRWRPLVTILIPVFNRAAACAQAVESCLAQSWRPTEILVIDDGSTDDLAQRLLPFGAAVRLLRKANGGVSSARNMGIAAALGEFVHFLDSDDVLRPDAVSGKVNAFARIADAELCYSTTEDIDFPPGAHFVVPAPNGTRACVTTDLMSRLALRHPFMIPTVMLPRWVALEAGPFEEDLRRREDSRYWLALGLRGTKVIGLRQPLTVLRFSQHGLTATAACDPTGRHLVRLRDLRDVLTNTRGWPFAPRFLVSLARSRSTDAAMRDDAAIHLASEELLSVLRRLAVEGSHDGHSVLPLAAALRDKLREMKNARRPLPDRLDRALPGLLAEMMRNAPPITHADAVLWSAAPAKKAQQYPIHRCMRAVARHCAGDLATLEAASWLVRTCHRVPPSRAIKAMSQLYKGSRSILLARTAALILARYTRSSA